MTREHSGLIARLAVLCMAFPPALCAADAAAVFTRAQLREDLAALDGIISEMHPDPAYTVDFAALDAGKRKLAAALESGESMTRDQAWALFATLNPAFADGHLLVSIPDWRDGTRAHLASGGVLFPFEVQVTERGEITILAALGGATDRLAGERVRAINGVDSNEVFTALMARVPGDTPAFRAGILSQRFWLYYWKVFGAPATYDFRLAGQRRVRKVAGAAAVPVTLAEETDFDRMYQFALLPDDAALLRVGSFVWEDKDRFLAFTKDAFRKMQVAGTKTLIIDIRTNTGGNDDMWREGILSYIATKPYRWASHYRKRVGTPDPAKNEKVGDIVDGELETWVPPQPDNPLHFAGKVYVLTGPATYSSSVVFSVVMQDFGFGTLVSEGAKDWVRASQTGGTRGKALPNSGLTVIVPRFILFRPSAVRTPPLLVPDIEIARQPLDPSAAIRSLLKIAKEKAHHPEG
jgi:hypothetical protein